MSSLKKPTTDNRPASSAKRGEQPTTDFSPESLLPTETIIKLSQAAGVNFGPGDPSERVRYFIKLGLLPHAVRRSITDTVNNTTRQSVGHLPYSSVKKLIQIDQLFRQGLSYPKIAQNLKKLEDKQKAAAPKAPSSQQLTSPIVKQSTKVVFWQKVGLGEKEIREKLKEHEQKIQRLVQEELASSILGAPQTEEVSSIFTTKPIPTEEVIKLAKEAKVNFGPGKPDERIRYFIKLGILPHAIRKSRDDDLSSVGKVSGHLPEWSIKRLIYINKLYQRGLSYPQIAQKIRRIEARKIALLYKKPQTTQEQISPVELTKYKPAAEIKINEKEIQKIVQKELTKSEEFPYSTILKSQLVFTLRSLT